VAHVLEGLRAELELALLDGRTSGRDQNLKTFWTNYGPKMHRFAFLIDGRQNGRDLHAGAELIKTGIAPREGFFISLCPLPVPDDGSSPPDR